MKILVVSDESDATELFKQRFRKEIKSGNVEPLFALSGDQALTIPNISSNGCGFSFFGYQYCRE